MCTLRLYMSYPRWHSRERAWGTIEREWSHVGAGREWRRVNLSPDRNTNMQCFAHGQKSRQGFTLVELLVVIAIVIILLALLIPSVSTALANQRQKECGSNQQQIFAGMQRAAADGVTVRSANWTDQLAKYVGTSGEVLYCPDDMDASEASSFGMTTRVHRLDDRDGSRIVMLDYKKTEAVLVVDSIDDQDDWSADDGHYADRHLQGINVLLHTGAVKAYLPEDIDPRVCELWRRYWRPHLDSQMELEGCLNDDEVVDTSPPESTDPGDPPDNSPDYPDLDSDKCGQVLLVADDADSSYFTLSEYDDSNNYDGMVEIFPGFSMPAPGLMNANFRGLAFSSGGSGTPLPGEYDPETADGEPYGGNHKQAEGCHAPSNAQEATFTFDELESGTYYIWAHWCGQPYHSPAAPITILDGDSEVGSVTVNQEMSSASFADSEGKSPIMEGSTGWYPIGEYRIDSDTIKIVFSAAAGAPTDQSADQHFVVADAVRIECADQRDYYTDRCYDESPPAIDENAATTTGGWEEETSEDAHGGSQMTVPAGSGNETASFTFDGITPGQYRVWTHFVPEAGQATQAPFTVYDGSTQYSTVMINQALDYQGVDLDGDGRLWYEIGQYDFQRQNGVRVVVSDNADATVVIDAVRISCAFGSYGTSADDCDRYGDIYGRECRKYYSDYDEEDEEIEEAVESALNWLSRHQYEGGHWSYDFTSATCPYIETPEPCENQCSNSGQYTDNKVAATGMALLPFLGAGFGPTHHKYGQVVTEGVNYLLGQVGKIAPGSIVSDNSGSGALGYEHGIGAYALVEALGVCRATGFGQIDQSQLTTAAFAVVARTVACQSARGGWGYSCGSEDDTTVAAWMLQTLMAARDIGIDYHSIGDGTTDANMMAFLDFVQEEVLQDAAYGSYGVHYRYGNTKNAFPARLYYAEDGSRSAGRLARLQLGVPSNAAAMRAGAADELSRISGGMEAKSYRNYYAHHFMRRMGGQYWEDWEAAMNTYLLETNPQPTEGHVRGSWNIGGVTLTSGCARLWDTVSGSMCLEVYYRYSRGF